MLLYELEYVNYQMTHTHSVRYTTKITAGFRKFCETAMIGARNKDGTKKIDPYTADRLLSHSNRGGIKMTKHYDESDIFEDYKHVIPDLTFSKEAEYKAKLDDVIGKLEGVEQAKTYIKQKEKEMNERMEELQAEMQEEVQREINIAMNVMQEKNMSAKELVKTDPNRPDRVVLLGQSKEKPIIKDGKKWYVFTRDELPAVLKRNDEGKIEVDNEWVKTMVDGNRKKGTKIKTRS
jgi:hypothetical protein